MPNEEETPAVHKPRNRRATTAKKTARKPAEKATATEDVSVEPSASLPPAATPQRSLRSQQRSVQPGTQLQQHAVSSLRTEAQHTPQPGRRRAEPASSSMTHNTAPHMSGRLGSRLTGVHAALPAHSGSHAEEVKAPVVFPSSLGHGNMPPMSLTCTGNHQPRLGVLCLPRV